MKPRSSSSSSGSSKLRKERKDTSPMMRVSFDNAVTVVLAPSREEFLAARCDLWWTKADYLSFQSTSSCEVRLYALFHNISSKEARRRLYQCVEERGLDYGFMNYIRSASVVSTPGDPLGSDADASTMNLGTPPPSPKGKTPGPAPSASTHGNDGLSLYVPMPYSIELKSDEQSRQLYYNRYHHWSSRLSWNRTSGILAAIGMFSFAVPIVGYYMMHS